MNTKLLTFRPRNDEPFSGIILDVDIVDEVLLDNKINYIQVAVYQYKEGLITKKELVERLKIIVGASEQG